MIFGLSLLVGTNTIFNTSGVGQPRIPRVWEKEAETLEEVKQQQNMATVLELIGTRGWRSFE